MRTTGLLVGMLNLVLMSFFGEIMPIGVQFVSAGGFILFLFYVAFVVSPFAQPNQREG